MTEPRRSPAKKPQKRKKDVDYHWLMRNRAHWQAHLHKPLIEAPYVVFDLETTGGNPENNGITEIYAVKYQHGEVKESFYSLINPERFIPPIVRKMTGITHQMVKDAPTIRDIMPSFLEFLGDHLLVSHNTIGDIRFLSHFAKVVCQHHFGNYYLCTHLLTTKLIPEAPDKSLDGLGVFLGCPEDNVHRAKEDTYLTLRLFQELLDRLRQADYHLVSDAIRLQGDFESNVRLGWAVPHEQEIVSKSLGVLEFRDRRQDLLFAVATRDMAYELSRLKDIEEAPRQLTKLLLQTHSIAPHEHPSMLDALLHESKLLEGSSVRYHPAKWQHRHLSFLNLIEGPNGIRFVLGDIHEQAQTVLIQKYSLNSQLVKEIQDIFLGLAPFAVTKPTRQEVTLPASLGLLLKLYLCGEEPSLKHMGLAHFWDILRREARQAYKQAKTFMQSLPEKKYQLHDLHSVSGILVTTGETQTDLLAIKSAEPITKHMISGDSFEEWFISVEGKAFYDQYFANSEPNGINNPHLTQNMLWFLRNYAHKQGFKFWAVPELLELKA